MEVFYFGESSHRLFGVLHEPSGGGHTGLVFCPSYGEEMAATYAPFARGAKELAERGYSVLRYHPFGTGESDGAPVDATVDNAVIDAVRAVNCLRERASPGRVGLMGMRFGGFVAVQAALASQLDFLVLWSPIVNLRQYCRELLRLRLTKEMVHQQAKEVRVTTQKMVEELEAGRPVDILGSEFSPKCYLQMNAPPPWPDRPPAPRVLWLARPRERGQAGPIIDAWKKNGIGVDFEFLDEPAFWEDSSSQFPEKFATASVAWLVQKVAPPASAS